MTKEEKDRLYAYHQRDVKDLTLDELDDYAILLHMVLDETETIEKGGT